MSFIFIFISLWGDKMGYTVYKHVFPNNKVYIGITRREPKARWQSGGHGYRGNVQMWADIKKYGWDSIEHIILYENKTREEASEIEKVLIKEYKSNQPEFGYNIQAGGLFGTSAYYDENYIVKLFNEGLALPEVAEKVGCCTRTASEILRKNGVDSNEILRRGRIIISEKEKTPVELKNKIISLFQEGKRAMEIVKETGCCFSVVKRTLKENGITHEDIMDNATIITRKNISYIKEAIQSGKTLGEIANLFHCTLSTVSLSIQKFLPELSDQIQKNRYNKIIEKNCKCIKQYDLEGNYIKTFSSISEAARQVCNDRNANTHIIQCCKRERNSASGFIWRYEEDDEDVFLPPSKGKHPVLQYDLQGNFIKRYESIKEAAKAMGCTSSPIYQVCVGRKKTVKGYTWKYENKVHNKRQPRYRKVSQYSLEKILLETYPSIKNASQKTGVRQDSISACCRGKQKTSGGYIWRYADEDNENFN